MKLKHLLFSSLLLLVFANNQTFAQAPPQGINYQAVARDGAGAILASTSLTIRATAISGSSSGTNQWEEVHSITTNQFGLFSIVIGNGSRTGGAQTQFANIDWSIGKYYLKIEINPGTGYVDMGTTQLQSVPYSLLSAKSTAMKLDDLTDVDASSPNNGEVLKYEASSGTWKPATDNTGSGGGSYVPGAGINITGVTITNTGDTDATDDITNFTNAGGDLYNLYPNPNVRGLRGVPLSTTAPTNGQVIKFNSTSGQWEPSADINVDAQTLSISGTLLTISNGNTVTLPSSGGGDNWGTQTAVTNAALTGNGTVGSPLDIAQQGATTGQTLKWMGAWVPRNDLDNQTLTFTGNQLTISGGNTVTIPTGTGGDDWGTQTAFTNLTLTGNGTSGSPLGIAQQSATNGQVLKWNGTTWAPAADAGGTSYTAGTGISIVGSVISATGDNWGTQTAFTTTSLTGNGTSGSPLGLAQQGAITGQVLQWNGTSWSPANPSGGADNWGSQVVQTGPELTGSGTLSSLLKLAPQGAANGQVLKYNGAQWVPGTDNDIQQLSIAGNTLSLTGGGSVVLPTGTTYTAGSGIAIAGTTISNNAVTDATIDGNGTTGTPLTIAQQGASSGQVLKWNGSTWAPAADAGTNYTAGAGISIVGTTISATGTGGDDWGSQTASTNATLTGNGTGGSPLGLAQQSATNGQVLKWNGTTWLPSADNNTDAQTLSITGNQLSISGGNSVTLPSSGGGSLSLVSASLSSDITLSAVSFTNLPGLSVSFTPTASQVFVQFTASGIGDQSSISDVVFRVLVNGVPVGGTLEKVGVITFDEFLFSSFYTTGWSSAFSKVVTVNPGVSNTVTVQYLTETVYGSSDVFIQAASDISEHATITVFNQ